MLGECLTLLLSVTLQVEARDRLMWQPDPVTGYFVRDASQILTSHVHILFFFNRQK
jgi:hypothetical protein